MSALRWIPESEAEQTLQDTFGRRVIADGFRPAERRWSWVRTAKDPIIEKIWVGALKGYGFQPGWSAQLTFVPHVTSGGNVRSGPSTALGVDPLDDPERYRLDRLTTNGFRSSRRFRRDVGVMASRAVGYATDWFDRITDVGSLLPLYQEAICAPVTRFGFENYPSQRLALAFVHSYLGNANKAIQELDGYLDALDLDITEQKAEKLRISLERRMAAVTPRT